MIYKFLYYECRLPILDVRHHESCGTTTYCVIKMKKSHSSQVWQALNGAITLQPHYKTVVAVDDDIDPGDADSVNWAIAFRVQPHRDVRIVQGMTAPLDPSVGPAGDPGRESEYPGTSGASVMLIDATTKWNYPPVSLPRKKFMERAKTIWEEEGLPALKPKAPWHGYSLGDWTKENEEEAELCLRGEYFQTGEKLARERIQL